MREEKEPRGKETTRVSHTASHGDLLPVRLLTKPQELALRFIPSWRMRNVRFYCSQVSFFNKALGKQLVNDFMLETFHLLQQKILQHTKQQQHRAVNTHTS